MTHRGQHDVANVLDRHVRPRLKQRPNLARQHHRLSGPRARPEPQELVDHRRGQFALGMRRQHQPHRVILNVRRDHHFPHEPLMLNDRRAVQDLLDILLRPGRGSIENLSQLLPIRVPQLQLEEESIELGFGQWVRALLLDRVLRGHDEERPVELVGLGADGHRLLLHRLQQRRLGLGRRPIDLVGEDDLSEDRPTAELELPPAIRLDHDRRAGDVGRHQIRRELDARERQVQRLGQRADQQSLAQAGHTLQQRVAAAEQARQHPVDDLLVADDCPLNLRLGAPIVVAEGACGRFDLGDVGTCHGGLLDSGESA